jgi:D-glycero-D-manno-heptose 1,7-bisphosphate phosphatase
MRRKTLDLSKYRLIIFDMNGTLTNTPFIDKQPLHMLPGRVKRCMELREQGIACAIATNQGGVAWGFTTPEAATEEVQCVAGAIGASLFEVAFGYPKHPKVDPQWSTPELLSMRKPAPGMLISIMSKLGVTHDATLMVGDLEEDEQAAKNAAVDFVWAKDFFEEDELPF